MKKILLILAFVLSLVFALSIVSLATDTENTYYVVQSEDSEIAEALRQEGKSVIGVSVLYSSRNDSIKEDSTYFLNQFNNSEINLILAENINYKISNLYILYLNNFFQLNYLSKLYKLVKQIQYHHLMNSNFQ